MDNEFRARIDAIGDDVSSSATAILMRALELLQDVGASRPDELLDVSDALRRAQPSMAGFWTMSERLRLASDPVAEIAGFRREVTRAPGRISREASSLILLRTPERARLPVRLVTCSSSAAVEQTILEVARREPVVVCCAESRPALEGRALAARLNDAGVAVDLYTDAGVSAAVPAADVVLVGADAIGPEHFINKVGTAALCTRALACGVPGYVLAGREKRLRRSVFDSLAIRDGPADEIWREAPTGIRRRNPYFERVPWACVTTVITDVGAFEPSALSSS
jgi:translation initiation factor 2B subunit (eIF-2B alpha/beta/delta family)